MDEGAKMHLLTSLLGNRRKTLESLERVLFLLDSRLDNGQIQAIHSPQLSEISTRAQSGFEKLAFAVIFDVTSNFSTSEGLVRDARDILSTILSRPDDQDFPRALYILRFSTKHGMLRRRFVAHGKVVGALMLVLERTAKSAREDLFPLVMDTLCYLIDDGAYDQRYRVCMFILYR
ncbi:hypothetical protein OG21DRAFT_153985 [Imleria badia]|nr:hypothetical protein OG21DRAFT_153985 [Imleria badia]